MKHSLLYAATLGAIACPAAAQDDRRTDLSSPSEADIATARAVGDGVIALIEGGDIAAALARVKESNPLWSEKASEVNLLTSQASGATDIYGAVRQCVPSSYHYSSSLRIELRYVCQHEKGLISWELRADKLPSGWTIGNVSFSDIF